MTIRELPHVARLAICLGSSGELLLNDSTRATTIRPLFPTAWKFEIAYSALSCVTIAIMDDMASRLNFTQPVLLRIGFACARGDLVLGHDGGRTGGISVTAKPTAQLLQLVNLPADKMEASVRGLLGTRLRRIENRQADSPGWMYVQSRKATCGDCCSITGRTTLRYAARKDSSIN